MAMMKDYMSHVNAIRNYCTHYYYNDSIYLFVQTILVDVIDTLMYWISIALLLNLLHVKVMIKAMMIIVSVILQVVHYGMSTCYITFGQYHLNRYFIYFCVMVLLTCPLLMIIATNVVVLTSAWHFFVHTIIVDL